MPLSFPLEIRHIFTPGGTHVVTKAEADLCFIPPLTATGKSGETWLCNHHPFLTPTQPQKVDYLFFLLTRTLLCQEGWCQHAAPHLQPLQLSPTSHLGSQRFLKHQLINLVTPRLRGGTQPPSLSTGDAADGRSTVGRAPRGLLSEEVTGPVGAHSRFLLKNL